MEMGNLVVTGVEPLSRDAIILQTHAPWLGGAKPGQFGMLGGIPGVLLARPMSIMELRPEGNVAWQVRGVGKGTRTLLDLDLGTELHGWGPLGNSFQLGCTNPVLVGGGVGMAPLHFLYQEHYRGKGVTLIEGNKDRGGPFLEAWLDVDEADRYLSTTEDGSKGMKGLVTVPLEALLEVGQCDAVFACGPDPMLKAVESLALKYGVSCQVALEARMACGVGGCRGCWDPRHKMMVCCDGPVLEIQV